MSTRGQVLIADTGVYLYQHSDAYDLANEVFASLKTQRAISRATDSEYLSRIIFEDMIGDYRGEETGYGIGTSEHGDIEFLVTVDCKSQTVTVEECGYSSGKTTTGVFRFDGTEIETS